MKTIANARQLITDLRKPSRTIREAALQDLVAAGPMAIPDLLQALDSPHARVRAGAVRVFGRIHDSAVIHSYKHLAEDPDYRVRAAAMEAMGQVGGRGFHPYLYARLYDEYTLVRYQAARAIARQPDKNDLLSAVVVRLMYETDSRVRSALGEVLRNRRWHNVRNLIRQLTHHSSDVVRHAALHILIQMDDQHAATRQVIAACLHDESVRVRRLALDGLRQFPADWAEPLAIAALKDRYTDVQYKAIEVLGEIGGEAGRAELLHLFTPENWSAAPVIAGALARLGGEVELAVLIDALYSDDHVLRRAALEGLAPVQHMEGLFFRLLNDDNTTVRAAALRNLSQRADPDVLEYLLDSIHDTSYFVRRSVAQGLRFYPGEAARDALYRMLDDDDADIRRLAVESLGTMDACAEARPLYRLYQQETQMLVRHQIVMALGRLPGAGKALVDILCADDSSLARTAAEMLGIRRERAAVPALLKLLESSPHPFIRRACITALGGIGDGRAIPVLALRLEKLYRAGGVIDSATWEVTIEALQSLRHHPAAREVLEQWE